MANDSEGPKAFPDRTGPQLTAIQGQATAIFTGAIAGVGAIMMTLTSSPTAQGASFLWLPAALQLMAGVWLGPVRGMIAGGVGAYLAGILAYAGFGPVNIVMNLVAGGVTNALMPGILFRLLRIDPAFSRTSSKRDSLRVVGSLAALVFVVMIASFVMMRIEPQLHLGMWAYVPLFLIVASWPLVLRDLKVGRKDFYIALLVCLVCSACSALVGCSGLVYIGRQSWPAALATTGLGWFLGNSVSCYLGLFVLQEFTEQAREARISTL